MAEIADTDLFLYEKVLQALDHLEVVREGNWPVTVTTADGVVTLEGVMPTSGHRQVVLRAVADVPGAVHVVDHLVEDRDIERSVATGLAHDPAFRAMRPLLVSSYRGEVILTGKVPSEEHRERSGEIAAGVHGVRSVINQVRLA